MDLDVVFLGTSGSVPTSLRAPTSLLVRRGGDRILFDCGEGTQRQLLRSGIGLVELPEIFLSHYHADHYLGLPGLLKTFALRGRESPLTIYGPTGLRSLLASLRRIFGRLTYELVLQEIDPGDALDRGDHRIVVYSAEHRVPANCYAIVEDERAGRFDVDAAVAHGVPEGPLWGRLQRGEAVELPEGRAVAPSDVLGSPRPGRRVVFSGDTQPARGVLDAAIGADLLVHEATFGSDESERARETGHATAAEAAELARVAGVKKLALTHLSNRYFGPELAREARAVFPDTFVPRDFDIIVVPFPERGLPTMLPGGAIGRAEGDAELARIAVESEEG